MEYESSGKYVTGVDNDDEICAPHPDDGGNCEPEETVRFLTDRVIRKFARERRMCWLYWLYRQGQRHRACFTVWENEEAMRSTEGAAANVRQKYKEAGSVM